MENRVEFLMLDEKYGHVDVSFYIKLKITICISFCAKFNSMVEIILSPRKDT